MADLGTPVADLTKRFAHDASKPGDPRSEARAELKTDRAKERAANGAASSKTQNDMFMGRRGKRAASY